ncbi:cation:H+ antiporter [Pseudonocardia hierapolitana]|uniref:Cation:H+ antiporter n=1 Tax=Pseudonocardia hierapolitana TaxID=1128676 RepID=A0A561T4X0_9PSEU|nr:calcium/sodium antiporter [Pseudonocardia hierapolitana]TWF82155.1 cation:H+ antiporter [Pseudonocardia hierapolitana]
MNPVLALILGLAALVVGAEMVVREGSALAARFNVSPLVVGMTIVSLGTSLPELAIGLNAAQQGNAGLAVGNIVGTNLVNILLILGLSALIRPIALEARTLRLDLPAMTGAALLLFVLAVDGDLTTADGLWLCLYGAAYLALLAALAHRESRQPAVVADDGPSPSPDPDTASTPPARARPVAVRALLLVLGLAVVVIGSEYLVDGAVEIARDLGASDAVIGLTIVAVGTSAPELVTTLVSTVRGDRSIALGNLIGSSVFNIALILGPTVLVAPGTVPVPEDVLALDLVLMVAAAVVCVPVFLTHRRLGRLEGAAFVTTYVAYMVWLLGTRL